MTLLSRRLCALVLATSAGLGACATTGDVEELSQRIDKLEDENNRSKTEDAQRLERLKAMLDDAEKSLRAAGADMAVRLERIEQDFPKVRGTSEALDFRMKQIERDLTVIKKELADRLGSTAVYLPPDLPKDADGVWRIAEERAKSDRMLEAKALFELFEASYPEDPRAPQALVRIAQLLEGSGDLDGAIKSYQAVYERHEKAPEAPASVLRVAEIFVVKGECARAKSIFEFVLKQFKGTPEAATAKERAKSVTKDCKKTE
ncbi:MAG: tetratricopeptide repeat protein [Deltaproteobacteria bacterium]|nr:tetratricopeptide repeat protein [Deltaproteobacteria bacterium]